MASLADAEEALSSTRAKANFQRLTRLLMCGGLRLLRETFDSIHSPADLPVKLSDPGVVAQLRGARLTRPEWDCLYPSPGVYGKSSDFDITLIFRLFRTICGLTPPPGPRGWDDLPNSSDHSLVADLVRIKYYRNGVHGHKNTMEISDLEFNDLWRKISKALIRIAASISRDKRDEWKKSIDDFLVNPLTPEEERYVKELDTWYKQDMDVKNEVEQLKEELKNLAIDMKGGHEKIQEEVARQFQQLLDINGPVAILVVNTIESITQAGVPISILNRPSGRHQIPPAGDSLETCNVAIPEREEGISDSEELQPNPLEPINEIHIWNVILSFKKSFELFLQYLGCKLNVFVRSHDVGSLLITVECSSFQILEGLWEDYHSGHLNKITQEILVTTEVLEKLGLDEVKLKTFISEEEYEKGKQIFMESSEISEETRSPEETYLLDKIAAEFSESLVEEGEDTVSMKKEDSDAGFQKKSHSSSQVQLKTPSELKQLRKAEKRKRRKERTKLRSLGLQSIQGEPEVETRLLTSSQQDYLQKISKLEKENIQLRTNMEAIEKALQGKKEHQQSKESTKMVQLESKIIELEKKVSAELKGLKDEVRSIRKELEEYQSRESLSISDPFSRRLEPKRILARDTLTKEDFPLQSLKKLTKGKKEDIQLHESTDVTKLENKTFELERRMVVNETARESNFAELVELRDEVRLIRNDLEQYRYYTREYHEEGVSVRSFRSPFAYGRRFIEPPMSAHAFAKAWEGTEGFCQIIVNREKHEVLLKEEEEIESVFQELRYKVNKELCGAENDVELVTNSLARRDYSDKYCFVCFILSNVTKNWEIETLGRHPLSVDRLVAKFRHSFLVQPKIFIVQGHQKSTALETDVPFDETSFYTVKLLPGANFLCLFVPYRKGYISTLLSVIKLHGSKRDLLYILSEAKKLFYEKSGMTIPDPVHNFSSKVYLTHKLASV